MRRLTELTNLVTQLCHASRYRDFTPQVAAALLGLSIGDKTIMLLLNRVVPDCEVISNPDYSTLIEWGSRLTMGLLLFLVVIGLKRVL